MAVRIRTAVEYGLILVDSMALLRGYDDVESKLQEGLKQEYGLDVKVFGSVFGSMSAVQWRIPDIFREEGKGSFIWESSGVSPQD